MPTLSQIVKYLSTPGLASTTRQSPRAVATLMRQLTDPSRAYGLTKAEVLGCVNIAPTKLVELFTVSRPRSQAAPFLL